MGCANITDAAAAELRARIGRAISRVTAPFYREINGDAARNFARAIGNDRLLGVDPAYGASTRWGVSTPGSGATIRSAMPSGAAAR